VPAKDIPAGPVFESGDTAPVVRTKLNGGLAWAEEQIQGVEDRLEGSVSALVGRGVVTGLLVTAGAGLSVSVASGTAVVGFPVTKATPSTVAVEPSATNRVYLMQDGSFQTTTSPTPPAGQECVPLATATTNAGAVTAVDNDPAGKPKLGLLSGLGSGAGIATTLLGEGVVRFDPVAGHRHDGVGSRALDGSVVLGSGPSDTVTFHARAILRTLGSDPMHATAGSRPAGSAGEVAYYQGQVYACSDGTVPVWRRLQEDKGFGFTHSASDSDVTTGDGKLAYAVGGDLAGHNVVGVVATVATAGSGGTTEVQLRRRRGDSGSGTDVDMLSTRCAIDSGERSSATAATAAVVDTASDDLQAGDLIYLDVDSVSSTKPKGLSVSVVCRLPA
jgi:hypothetical protein